jgi:glycosyltransferase involved in cell wall biosynthesis
VILGGGDDAPLLQQAQSLGFASQLTLCLAEDVQPWLHAADLYVSASSSESFGMANLEALCAGLPCLCSAVGGVPEVVGDGGWLVPNDTETLARCIRTMRTDASARREWSLRALERVSTWPSAEEIAQRHVAIYRSADAR